MYVHLKMLRCCTLNRKCDKTKVDGYEREGVKDKDAYRESLASKNIPVVLSDIVRIIAILPGLFPGRG